MWGRARWCASVLLPAVLACTEINTDPQAVVSVSIDVATPSVVAGDTLRDTLGVVQPLLGMAYNYRGVVISGYPIKYRVIGPGLRVDSLTGIVVADTPSAIAVRVLADAGGLQTQPLGLFVVPQPYQIVGVTPAGLIVGETVADTVGYSVRDTTHVISPALNVRVLPQDTLTTTVPINGYLVSYAIQFQHAADTLWAQLVSPSGQRTLVDTTGGSGVAGAAVLLRPLYFPTRVDSDSVVVLATVRYRGMPVMGSPVRFVVQIKPGL
jgi:hypothetical protein